MEIQLQCLLGMACKNFTIVAADQTRTISIIVLKDDENKLHEINDRLMMAVIGNAGDAAQFTQFVCKNIELYKLRNRYTLSTPAAVHFTRKNMADNLRGGEKNLLLEILKSYKDIIENSSTDAVSAAQKRAAWTTIADNYNTSAIITEQHSTMINMLMAGYDKATGGQLYSLDFLGSCVKVPFAVHGFGGQIAMTILDYYYNDSLSESEAYEVLKMAVREIHQRFFVSLPNFQVKSVSKHGIKELPIISPAAFSHLS